MHLAQNNFIIKHNNSYNKNSSSGVISSRPENSLLNQYNKNVSFTAASDVVKSPVKKFIHNLNPEVLGTKFFSWEPVSKLFEALPKIRPLFWLPSKKISEFGATKWLANPSFSKNKAIRWIAEPLANLNLSQVKPINWVSKKLQIEKNNIIFKQPALDLVGCVLYVQAALNNKQVPSDKRPFIAAYDAINGVTTVALSIGFGLLGASEKFANRVNEKLFKAVESKNPTLYKSMPKYIQATFGIIASTILAKRILAPLISTPAATSLKSKFGGKKDGKPYDEKVVEKTVSQSKLVDNKAKIEEKIY